MKIYSLLVYIMYTHIYQNSYIMSIILFALLCAIFYMFQIGYNSKITPNGQLVKTFSWKYPLAITLIFWVIWHFYVYPPIKTVSVKDKYDITSVTSVDVPVRKRNIASQKINMENWN